MCLKNNNKIYIDTIMCQLTTCPTCKKYSFKGCGQHLASIFAGKRMDELCSCPTNTRVAEFKKGK